MNHILKIVAAAAIAGAASGASAVTLVNGSFEAGSLSAPFETATAGSSAITGWTVGGFGVDYVGSYWMASDGVRSVDLSGLNAGSVSQAFATTIGSNYTVTFDLSGNPDGGVGTRTAIVSIDGSLPSIKSYVVAPSNSRESMNWQTYSYDFTAFTTTSRLVFASADYTPFGPALDNVSVIDNGGGAGSTVPEPATWAMLMIGFGMVGMTVRSRRTAVVAA
ncbi:hypothetical protein GCM10011529_12890 [Polymorphobacter glacialis]|uniref:Choice-of-anchor C family protein n=1 Tax=Sandarakinorhabdus glacialis TaxID=1614636 RepID=A0A917E5X2_9SPHN|nr:choice-of-anchor C family protein [Polymorphobacter glacialis]GGE07899.1 hypothetical protein GCM10011529_12890 [Polymorphobacter glacialis]